MSEILRDKNILDKDYSFARVYQPLNVSAKLKSQPEDFIVEENISIDFSNEGEHCWLYVKKCGCNTDWVAQQLAKYCGVKQMAVSYAGLKDRHAVTSQWFSVQLPGLPTPDWSDFESMVSVNNQPGEDIKVLESHRHNKKLQRGALKSNWFKITLRELSDTGNATFTLLKQRCESLSTGGVPNYFGLQRFGRNHNNLDQAIKLFANPRFRISRQKRGMYYSAARSWLFNLILSERIKCNVWDKRLPGDVFMLAGKSACFKDELSEQSSDGDKAGLNERLQSNDIHPTAPLWGDGETMVELDAADFERRIIDQIPVYRDGLVSARVQSRRRACRVLPAQLDCYRQGEDFVVSFSLPAGSYATMVLAEIFSELH
jgi:tRNA pseudouridine13 synthase